MIYVYAKWTIDELPEDMIEFYIQCGIETDERSEDWESFTIDDNRAELKITKLIKGYQVILIVPSLGHEKEEGFCLSPACINDNHEAKEFGDCQFIAGELHFNRWY